jgi:BirA family biotin operon repressor/biotin-[acetyl-CoA-carboxylase] ligase
VVGLGASAREAGFRLIHLASVGSTMDEAWARAEAGEAGNLWIVADRQTKGRGRSGRTWVSDKGNLFATLLLRDACPARHAPQLVFVAALALCDAVAAAARPAPGRLSLKWPNDLLLDGAKVSGILAESRHGGAGEAPIAAIGFGVNVMHAPEGTPYPVTDLRAGGLSAGRDDLLAALAGSMALRIAQWRRGDGFSKIRTQWLELAHPPGTALRIKLTSGDVAGSFAGLDAEGRLLIACAGKVLRVDAGDVTIVPKETVEKS